MHSHPYFDLYLHSDEELAELVGERVTSRESLHEWPLSSVERVHLESGSSFIYKVEAPPTVEPEFYASVKSSVLVNARTLYRDNRYACMAIEEVVGPSMERLSINVERAIHIGRTVISDFESIQGDPPVYLDLSTYSAWQAQMSGMLDDLSGLVQSGKFSITHPDDLDTLARAIQSSEIRDAYKTRGVGLVHNDLTADNILFHKLPPPAGVEESKFVYNARLVVIDWQRPLLALHEIDMIRLLVSLGYDPRPHVHPGVSIAADLLSAHWLIECARTWFPPGTSSYDQAVAAIARGLKT